jgi:IS4 transposase
VMNEVFERFAQQSPVTVMARMALQRAVGAEWVDEVFEQHRTKQYARELLFSTVVDLMMLVALGQRPSLHAAARKYGKLPTSISALYQKTRGTEPAVIRSLVRGSAERLTPVRTELRTRQKPWLRGYRVRVLDGNHLPASEKRLKPLRGFRGAALPGHSLVVYDAEQDLVVDIVPCEDAHTHEHAIAPEVWRTAREGDLWMGDRAFCTRESITDLTGRNAALILREAANYPNPTRCGRRHKVGRIDTGVVYETPVTLPLLSGETVRLRRIELHLDVPTEDGETVIRLLTNLPARVSAKKVARLYRKRWTIEGMFQRLEAVLKSEVQTMAHPRAALLAFGCAVVAYNVLAVLQAAIEATHDLPVEGTELSMYYLADDVRADYRGMIIAIAPEVWEKYDAQSAKQLARTLERLARQVEPQRYRKTPRAPKSRAPKGYAPRSTVTKQLATARVLAENHASA